MGHTVQCSRFPISCWQSMAEPGTNKYRRKSAIRFQLMQRTGRRRRGIPTTAATRRRMRRRSRQPATSLVSLTLCSVFMKLCPTDATRRRSSHLSLPLSRHRNWPSLSSFLSPSRCSIKRRRSFVRSALVPILSLFHGFIPPSVQPGRGQDGGDSNVQAELRLIGLLSRLSPFCQISTLPSLFLPSPSFSFLSEAMLLPPSSTLPSASALSQQRRWHLPPTVPIEPESLHFFLIARARD